MTVEVVGFPDLNTSGIMRTTTYTDIDEFLNAVKEARKGDQIILANGNHKLTRRPKPFSKKGTDKNPIIVRAENVGGATLKGKTGLKFKNCEHFTWYGFHHEQDSSPGEDSNIAFEGGKNNRFARCEVNLDDKSNTKRHWLRISNCEAIKVDHCYFHHKKSEGQFCSVYLKDNEPGKGPLFEYNYFQHQDFGEHLPPGTRYGDAGGEAIQMGHSDHARKYYRAIVRYNYFEECNGDGEIVSNKSCGNLFYNNTFTDCDGSLTLRHGHSIAVLGNYFKNCGLRVCGENNLIANNHFTENSRKDNRQPLVIMNGKKEGNYRSVVNNDIILNTLANGNGKAKQIVLWGSGNGKDKPRDNRFRGNIITGKYGKLLEFVNKAKATGNTITDNIGWHTGKAEVGHLADEMATITNPLLTKDKEDGIYRLQSGSPARGKIRGEPFRALTDIDIYSVERSRKNTDIGCHQYSTTSTRPKKRITTTDVGPKAPAPFDDNPVWSPPILGA